MKGENYETWRYILCGFKACNRVGTGGRKAGTDYTEWVLCAAITSKMNKAKLPTHIELNADEYDMVKDSVILLEQLRTIDKKRLKDKVCHLDSEIMGKVNEGLLISLELGVFCHT